MGVVGGDQLADGEGLPGGLTCATADPLLVACGVLGSADAAAGAEPWQAANRITASAEATDCRGTKERIARRVYS